MERPKRDYETASWLTVNEACSYSTLSRSTISRAMSAGALPFSRAGSRVLIRRVDLDGFLAGELKESA